VQVIRDRACQFLSKPLPGTAWHASQVSASPLLPCPLCSRGVMGCASAQSQAGSRVLPLLASHLRLPLAWGQQVEDSAQGDEEGADVLALVGADDIGKGGGGGGGESEDVRSKVGGTAQGLGAASPCGPSRPLDV
jgi:hypothetical protein